MNREQRRAFNKKHKTNYTKDDFDTAIALARIKAAAAHSKELQGIANAPHRDNEELAPEGCEVKLNYEDIYKRPQDMLTDEFKSWVEEHKDAVMHLTREGTDSGLVSVVEDNRKNDEGEVKPKWLFDLYTDLVIKDKDGEFKHMSEIDPEYKENYTDITNSAKIVKDYVDETKAAEAAQEAEAVLQPELKAEETEKTAEN